MSRLSPEEIDTISRRYLELRNKSDTAEGMREFKSFQNYCIKEFTYLIKSRVMKYRKFSNYQDLEQEGFKALILSFDSFNPDKGSFTWWADRYISTHISRAANAHSTIRFPIKKAKKVKPYKVSKIPVMIDDNQDPFFHAQKNELNHNISKAVSNLNGVHKDIINMTYGFNGVRERSVNDLLKDLNITRPQYLKFLKEAKDKIKQQLIILK